MTSGRRTVARRAVLATGISAVAAGGIGLVARASTGNQKSPATEPGSSRRTARTFYVSRAGSDRAAGTSAGAPWKSVDRVNAARLVAGSKVLFARGETFTGASLTISASGTRNEPITVGAFGSGALPVFDGGGTDAPTAGRYEPIKVNGDWVVVTSVQCQYSSLSGIDVRGSDCVVRGCVLTHNAFGVQQQSTAARLTVTRCRLVDNTFEIIGSGNDDDYGCNGVSLGGDSAEISYNYSEGNVGLSPDYGTDGSFCEVFNATNANVHHNVSMNDLAFTELGNSTTTRNNAFHHNIMWSAVKGAGGLNVHGSGDFGGVQDTSWINNTVYLVGAGSVGFFVVGPTRCTVHNNIFVSGFCGNSGSTIDEAGNVYTSTKANQVLSLHSASGKSSAPSSVVTGTPGLVGPGLQGDFHLTAASPAIDRGVATPYTGDFDGKSMRGKAWDCGAYEFEG